MKNGFVAKNGLWFFPKKSCFFRIIKYEKKNHFCHKMIFSYFLKSHFGPFDMKNGFFFSYYYTEKKSLFAVKTTFCLDKMTFVK